MINRETLFLHALSQIQGLSLPARYRLLEVAGSAERAWQANAKLLQRARIKNAGEYIAQRAQIDFDRVIADVKAMREKWNVQLITIDDETYPRKLKEISHPPRLLYCRGDIDIANTQRSIAVVGSRKGTSYGKGLIAQIVPQLSQAGAVIVSGLALGIDAAAHRETFSAKGRTIAVLGSSPLPDEIAPASNRRLAERLVDAGGLIMSEYPPGTPGYASHFPERNRIIAGLSDAVIVVEAAERSGSLITARLASESSRDVFAVPGAITAPQSRGTNSLIARGAIPLLSCDTVFDALEWNSAPEAKQRHLSKAEQQIVHLCSETSLSVDEMIEHSDLSPSEAIATITQLTLSGIIQEIDGKISLVS